MMLIGLRILVLLSIFFIHTSVFAATTTANLPISATVVTACSIGTVVGVAFGNYDPTSATANNATGTIPVTCTNGAPYNIGLGPGTFAGATVTTRRMTGTPAGTPLSYSLFRDAGRTLNWGVTIGTDTLALTGTGVAQSTTVFGQIPALQAVTAGTYADTVLITVTF